MRALLVGTLVLTAVLATDPGSTRRLRRLVGAPRDPRRTGRRPAGGVAEQETDLALLVDLVAAALGVGTTPFAALDAAGRAVGGRLGMQVVHVAARLRLGSDWSGAWAGADPELEPLRRCLGLVAGSGAPGAELLRDTASELRRRRQRAAQLEAARLGVRLVLPLGLCALPAFLVLGVVPVVLSLATRVLAGAP